MDLNRAETVRITKRLTEAVGYLELGLTRQALVCIDRLGDLGPFTVVAQILRGEAARQEHRLDDAAALFDAAARQLPAAYAKPLWLALSAFYQHGGETAQAVDTQAQARGAQPRGFR